MIESHQIVKHSTHAIAKNNNNNTNAYAQRLSYILLLVNRLADQASGIFAHPYENRLTIRKKANKQITRHTSFPRP